MWHHRRDNVGGFRSEASSGEPALAREVVVPSRSAPSVILLAAITLYAVAAAAAAVGATIGPWILIWLRFLGS